jgi:hypothetical protein
MHRTLDVLDAVLAHVFEHASSLAFGLIFNHTLQRRTTHRSQRLDACGDVDAFAVDVVAIDDDFAEIDADAVAQSLSFLGCRLDRQRAVHGGDDAGKLHQRPVAHEFELRPAVRGHLRIEHRESAPASSRFMSPL